MCVYFFRNKSQWCLDRIIACIIAHNQNQELLKHFKDNRHPDFLSWCGKIKGMWQLGCWSLMYCILWYHILISMFLYNTALYNALLRLCVILVLDMEIDFNWRYFTFVGPIIKIWRLIMLIVMFLGACLYRASTIYRRKKKTSKKPETVYSAVSTARIKDG